MCNFSISVIFACCSKGRESIRGIAFETLFWLWCVVKTRAILETRPPLSDILQRVGCSISRNYEFSFKNFHFGSPRIGASDSKGKQKGENDDCNTLIGPVMQWLRRKTSNLKVPSSNLDAARGPVPRSRATRAGRAPGPVRDDGRRGAELSGSGEGKGEGEGEGDREGEGEEKGERKPSVTSICKGKMVKKQITIQWWFSKPGLECFGQGTTAHSPL